MISPVSIGHYFVIFPIGSYCENGVRQYCPVGTYGESRGLSSKTCSRFCPQGHYCEKGTIAKTIHIPQKDGQSVYVV